MTSPQAGAGFIEMSALMRTLSSVYHDVLYHRYVLRGQNRADHRLAV